ncbi:hypothetical protein [Furfurilactobacillus siliginis]|uniref:Uncharacterized protein n=1 Tax=Furfurilactobacillus siliginis TaxID=348151 RepID=A0A0R2LFK3_9LACO|nr:hypothetical protein [Furfurilactobacillus siliginis]KRN96836.1 hypothetical protein IV55_GL000704 [Furfurilactobacillus siliginis]GEK28502.1 hypothetical protein LSI01_08130 [Furfurilactobacillus siliginis]
MKTSELKQQIRSMGFNIEEYEDQLVINGGLWKIFISKTDFKQELQIMTYSTMNIPVRLWSLVSMYVLTPMDERGEPKKYRAPIPGMTLCGMQAYLASDAEDEWCVGNQDDGNGIVFTEQERADAPSWIKRDWWEKVK